MYIFWWEFVKKRFDENSLSFPKLMREKLQCFDEPKKNRIPRKNKVYTIILLIIINLYSK